MCYEAVLLDSVLRQTVLSLKDGPAILVSLLTCETQDNPAAFGVAAPITVFEKYVNCSCPEAAGRPQPSLHRPRGTVPRAVVPGRRGELHGT